MKEKVSYLGINVTNINRVIFPKNKITKQDVLNYYSENAKKILPYLKNRLVSEVRIHGDINSERFFKKHPQKNEDVERYYIGKKIPQNEYFYINTKKQLLNQVQMGAVEFHIWNSQIDNLTYPDFMIFDLDPDENLSIKKLQQGVKLLKKLLDKLKLKSFLKTSGGKGYHILVKIENLTYRKVENLSKQISRALEAQYPDLFVTTMSKEKRKDKIFIDYLRNKKGATCVCPYSLRLRKNATISMPIFYSKLEKFSPDYFNILNYKNIKK